MRRGTNRTLGTPEGLVVAGNFVAGLAVGSAVAGYLVSIVGGVVELSTAAAESV